MGRASQVFDFINSEKMPTKEKQDFRYSHLTVDDDLKKTRREYRAQLRAETIMTAVFQAIDFLARFSVIAERATKEHMDNFIVKLDSDKQIIARAFLASQVEARKSFSDCKVWKSLEWCMNITGELDTGRVIIKYVPTLHPEKGTEE